MKLNCKPLKLCALMTKVMKKKNTTKKCLLTVVLNFHFNFILGFKIVIVVVVVFIYLSARTQKMHEQITVVNLLLF